MSDNKEVINIKKYIKNEMASLENQLIDDFNYRLQDHFHYDYIKGYYRALKDLSIMINTGKFKELNK